MSVSPRNTEDDEILGRTIIKILTEQKNQKNLDFETELHKYDFGLVESSGDEIGSLILSLLQHFSQKYWINLELDDNIWKEPNNFVWTELTAGAGLNFEASITIFDYLSKARSSRSSFNFNANLREKLLYLNLGQGKGSNGHAAHTLGSNSWVDLRGMIQNVLSWFQQNFDMSFSVWLVQNGKVETIGLKTPPDKIIRHIYMFKDPEFGNFRAIVPRQAMFEELMDYANALMNDLSSNDSLGNFFSRILVDTKEDDLSEEIHSWLARLKKCKSVQELLDNILIKNNAQDRELYPLEFISRLEFNKEFLLPLNEKLAERLRFSNRLKILRKTEAAQREAEKFKEEQEELTTDKETVASRLQEFKDRQIEFELAIENEQNNIDNQNLQTQLLKSLGLERKSQLHHDMENNKKKILKLEEEEVWIDFQISLQSVDQVEVETFATLENSFHPSPNATLEQILESIIQILKLPKLNGALKRRAQRNDILDKEGILQVIKNFFGRPKITHNSENKRILEVFAYNVTISLILQELMAKVKKPELEIQEVRIVASRLITIDIDMNLPGINLFMYAPIFKVENQGSQNCLTINTSGRDGLPYLYKGDPTTVYGATGNNGSDGNPGQSAGHVQIISDKQIPNLEFLRVRSNGGNGGKGQDGGDGAEGKRGENGKDAEDPGEPGFGRGIVQRLILEKGTEGSIGGRGGDGGSGGCGGLGGTRGNILIQNGPDILMAETEFENFECLDGKMGERGQGGNSGIGGMGGVDGIDQGYAKSSMWFWRSWSELKKGRLKETEIRNWFGPNGWELEVVKTVDQVKTEHKQRGDRGNKGKSEQSHSRSQLVAANREIALDAIAGFTGIKKLNELKFKAAADRNASREEQIALRNRLTELKTSDRSDSEEVRRIEKQLKEMRKNCEKFQKEKNSIQDSVLRTENELIRLENSIAWAKQEEESMTREMKKWDLLYDRFEKIFSEYLEQLRLEQVAQIQTRRQTMRNVELNDGRQTTSTITNGNSIPWTNPLGWETSPLQTQIPGSSSAFARDQEIEKSEVVKFYQILVPKLKVPEERIALEHCLQSVLLRFGTLPPEYCDVLKNCCIGPRKEILGYELFHYIEYVLPGDTISALNNGWVTKILHLVTTKVHDVKCKESLSSLYALRTNQLDASELKSFEHLLKDEVKNLCDDIDDLNIQKARQIFENIFEMQIQTYFISECVGLLRSPLEQNGIVLPIMEWAKKGARRMVKRTKEKIWERFGRTKSQHHQQNPEEEEFVTIEENDNDVIPSQEDPLESMLSKSVKFMVEKIVHIFKNGMEMHFPNTSLSSILTIMCDTIEIVENPLQFLERSDFHETIIRKATQLDLQVIISNLRHNAHTEGEMSKYLWLIPQFEITIDQLDHLYSIRATSQEPGLERMINELYESRFKNPLFVKVQAEDNISRHRISKLESMIESKYLGLMPSSKMDLYKSLLERHHLIDDNLIFETLINHLEIPHYQNFVVPISNMLRPEVGVDEAEETIGHLCFYLEAEGLNFNLTDAMKINLKSLFKRGYPLNEKIRNFLQEAAKKEICHVTKIAQARVDFEDLEKNKRLCQNLIEERIDLGTHQLIEPQNLREYLSFSLQYLELILIRNGRLSEMEELKNKIIKKTMESFKEIHIIIQETIQNELKFVCPTSASILRGELNSREVEPWNFEYLINILLFCTNKTHWKEGLDDIEKALKYLAIMIPTFMLAPEELLDPNDIELEPIPQEQIDRLANLQSKLKTGFSKFNVTEKQAKEILGEILGILHIQFTGLLENHKKRGTGSYKFNSYFIYEKSCLVQMLKSTSSKLIAQMRADFQLLQKFKASSTSAIFAPSNYLIKCRKVLDKMDWINSKILEKIKSVAYEEIIGQINQSHQDYLNCADPPSFSSENFTMDVLAILNFYVKKSRRDSYNFSRKNQLIAQLECLVQSSASDFWKCPNLLSEFIHDGFRTYGQDFISIAQVLSLEFQKEFLQNKSFVEELRDGLNSICSYSSKETLVAELTIYIRFSSAIAKNKEFLKEINIEDELWKCAEDVAIKEDHVHSGSYLEKVICTLGHQSFDKPSSFMGEYYRRLAKCLRVDPDILVCCKTIIYKIAYKLDQSVPEIAKVFGTKFFNEEELKYWQMLQMDESESDLLQNVLSILESSRWAEEIKLQLFNKLTRSLGFTNSNLDHIAQFLEISRDFAKQKGEEFDWFVWIKEIDKSFTSHNISALDRAEILEDILHLLSTNKELRIQDLLVIVQSKFPNNWSCTLIGEYLKSNIQNVLERSPNREHLERDIIQKFDKSVEELMGCFNAKKEIIILFADLLRQEYEEMRSKYTLIQPQQIHDLMKILINQQQPMDEFIQFLLEDLKNSSLNSWKNVLRKYALLRKGLPLKLVALCQEVENKVSSELIDNFLNICDNYFSKNLNFMEKALVKFKSSEWNLTNKILKKIRRNFEMYQDQSNTREEIFINIFNCYMETLRKSELKDSQLIEEIKGDPINQTVFSLNAYVRYAEDLKRIKNGLNKLSTILQNTTQSKPIGQWESNDISFWAEKTREKIKNARSTDEAVKVEILSVFLRAVKIYQGYSLWDTQILTILGFLNHTTTGRGLLGQISTGEGKTIIAALTAIYWGLCGKHSNIITSSAVLAEENCKSMTKLFQMFGISIGNNCDEKCKGGNVEVLKEKQHRYKNNSVLYGDLPTFQGDILRTEFFGEAVTGGREPDFVFVDEVDSMLLDKGGNVLYISHPIAELMDLRFIFIKIWSLVNSNSEVLEPINVVRQVRLALQNNTLKIPSSLKEFVKQRLEIWVNNAYEVKALPLDDQYRLGERSDEATKIVVMDKDTGEEQVSTQFSYAVQQFLQLKHSKKLTPESLKAVFMSNLSYFQKYPGKVFGMTGTLGSRSSRDLMESCYNVDFFRMPRHKFRNCVEEDGIVCPTQEQLMSEFVKQVQTKVLKKRRSILLICENIKSVKNIKDVLASKFSGLKSKIHTYESAHQHTEFMDGFKKGVRPGTVIIGTNLAGRGMDLKISQKLDALGGLHVILTYMPTNSRIEEQAFGRTARAGGNGSVQFIIWHETPEITIEILQYIREEDEKKRLELIKTLYLPQNECEEMLFKKFTALYNRTSDSEALKNLNKDIKKQYLQFLNNRWAFWLDAAQEKLKRIHKNGQQEIIEEYEKFELECIILANGTGNPEKCLASSSQEFVALARAFENNGNLTEAIVLLETAITREPELNEIPHYYIAGCHLQMDGENHAVRKKAIRHLKAARKCIQRKISSLNQLYGSLKMPDCGKQQLSTTDQETPLIDQILNEIEILTKYSDQIQQGIGARRVDKFTFSKMQDVLDENESEDIFKEILTNPRILNSWKISKKVTFNFGSRNLLHRGQPLKLDGQIAQYQEEIIDLLRQKLESMNRRIKPADFRSFIMTKELFWLTLQKINFFSREESTEEIYVKFSEQTYMKMTLPHHLNHLHNSLGFILSNQDFHVFNFKILSPLKLTVEECNEIEQLLLANQLLQKTGKIEGIISPEFSARLKRNFVSGVWEWISQDECPASLRKFPLNIFSGSIEDLGGFGERTLICRQELLPFCWMANKESECEKIMEHLIEQGIIKEPKVNFSFTNAIDYRKVEERIANLEKAVDESKLAIQIIFEKSHQFEKKKFERYIANIKSTLKESIGVLKLVKNVQVTYTKLDNCFADSKKNLPIDEIIDFHVWNFELMMTVDEMPCWWTTRSFILTMLGIGQLALATVLLVASGGTLFNTAMILGSEGISDIFYSRMNKNFNWTDYACHKIFSAGVSCLTGGLDGLFHTGAAGDIVRRIGMESMEEVLKIYGKRMAKEFGYGLSAWATQKGLDLIRNHLFKRYKAIFVNLLKQDTRFTEQLTLLKKNLTKLHTTSYQIGQAEKFLTKKEEIFVIGEKSEIGARLDKVISTILPTIMSTLSTAQKKSGVFFSVSNSLHFINALRITPDIRPLLDFTNEQVVNLNNEIERKIVEMNHQKRKRIVQDKRSPSSEFEGLAKTFIAKVETDIAESVLKKLQKEFAEPAVNSYMATQSARIAAKFAARSSLVVTSVAVARGN